MIIWTTGKKVLTVVIAIIIIVPIVLMFMNYLPNPLFPYQPPEPPVTSQMEVINLTMQEGMDVFEDVIENFPLDVEALEDLNVKFYGVTNETTSNIINWYDDEIRSSGWDLIYNEDDGGVDWEYRIRGYSRGLMGQFIIAYGGTEIQNETDYDLILVTSSGTLTEFMLLIKEV